MRAKHKLIILGAAQDELDEIARTHRILVGPKSARKIGERIYGALERLRDHPFLGAASEDSDLAQRGFRRLVCDRYLCFYRLVGETVCVYHIADGRTEYKQLFRGLLAEAFDAPEK